MKTRSIAFSVFLITVLFVVLTGCSGNKDETTESHEGHGGHNKEEPAQETQVLDAGEPQFQVDKKFQEQLSAVFTSYVELKDAFIDSDAQKVGAKASETSDKLEKVDMKLLSGAAHHDWMSYLAPLQASLKEIQSGKDIEAQRKSFSTLSNELYKSVKAFGLGGDEAFYEFCPMAFNNEGAYWLSDSEQIRNPYFGEKMLTCGSVQEKLK